MKTLLAVSPHIDDAVFSAGALLARHAGAGWRVVIATCFTRSVPNPSGFALACQIDKGLDPQADYMALRREEDREACAIIGTEPIHLDLPEAPHRGYGDATALFGPRLMGDEAAGELGAKLAALIAGLEPDCLLGPAAIGDHVDHWIVREALVATARLPLCWWADLPYAARNPPREAADELRLRCGMQAAAKLSAARAYRTQLAFQFGGPDRVGAVLGDAETYWPAASWLLAD